MAAREEMIVCSACGAKMKKSQRCCMKCGQLNYSHPENASMLKFANNSVNNNSYVVGSGKLIGRNNGKKKTGGDNFSYEIASNAGDRKTCLILNFGLLIIATILLFLTVYDTGDAVLDVLTSTSFNIMFIILLFSFLESVSMQFLYMKANKPWWSFFIPFYNWYVYFEITMNKGLLFLTLFIPVVGVIFFLVSMYKLGEKFGYSGIFSLLLFPIALPVIGFNTASAYEEIYYVSSENISSDSALAKEYKSNKNLLLTIFILMFIDAIVLIYFNLNTIINKIDKLKFIYDSGQILETLKEDIASSDYVCDNGFNINDDGTFYVMFGDDEDNFKSDIENIDEYSGYIKVVNSTGHQKFLITIYNDKFGIENASLTSLKKYKVEVNNASNVKKLDNIIKCYKK